MAYRGQKDSQKPVEELRQVSDELQFRNRVQHRDPRHQKASRERAEDVYPVRQQWDKPCKGESAFDARLVSCIKVVRMWNHNTQVSVSFIGSYSGLLCFGIVWDVKGGGFCDNVFEEAV